ncbi:hypothetical protein IE53DRAFT_227395 [Violaceomyces palustris]|uniref:Uncharacterized protein n=1 Tax=Violaceomyces palustris TaxID=1673888 RepID=A0ACD0NPU6_9BASI|nr:hypothetical protein IE53DRAFT_227395 [Violaceomyces palustris]
MKLDATDIRYISAQEFRVLTAVEMGSKNHEVVPSSLIAQISGLHHSGINKIMGALAKRNLIARVQNTVYDGYRLTYGGYDYLAIRTFTKRDSISAVGRQIGVGKESDIYVVSSPEGEERIMKIHRLGRISFRNVKEKRDYMGKRKSASWMYMSRLAAAKEYAFMQILHAHGFPVPEPIDQARHCIIMSLIDAFPLRQIAVLPPKQIPILYSALMKLIVRLARAGLIHGDFNEFNLLIKEIKNEGSEGTESEDRPQVEEKGPRGRAAQASMKDVAEKMKEPAPVSESLVVGQGERIERGKGFERVIKEATAGETENDSESEEEEEDDDDEDDDEDDATEEGEGVEDDGDGQIYVEDGVRVEPVLIDFPQMVSVEHENAE